MQAFADFLSCRKITDNLTVEVASGTGPYDQPFEFYDIDLEQHAEVTFLGNQNLFRHENRPAGSILGSFINVNNFVIRDFNFYGSIPNEGFYLIHLAGQIPSIKFVNNNFTIRREQNFGMSIGRSVYFNLRNVFGYTVSNRLDIDSTSQKVIIDSCVFSGGFRQVEINYSNSSISNSSFLDFYNAIRLNFGFMEVLNNRFDIQTINAVGSPIRPESVGILSYETVGIYAKNEFFASAPNSQLPVFMSLTTMRHQYNTRVCNNVVRDLQTNNYSLILNLQNRGTTQIIGNTFELLDRQNQNPTNQRIRLNIVSQPDSYLDFHNNIIILNDFQHQGNIEHHLIRFVNPQNINWDHNIYYWDTTKNNTQFAVFHNSPISHPSFRDWQQNNYLGLDQNAQFINPNLVRPEPNWLIPTNPSVIQSGLSPNPPYLSHDFRDSTRLNPTTPGAFEYYAIECPEVSDVTWDFVSPNSVAVNWNANFLPKWYYAKWGPSGFSFPNQATHSSITPVREITIPNVPQFKCIDLYLNTYCEEPYTDSSKWTGPFRICNSHWLGLDEASMAHSNSFYLFPNPNSGSFTLAVHNLRQSTQLDAILSNSNGQNVYSGQHTIHPNHPELHFDFNNLSKGIYLMRIKTEAQVSMQKLVIR
jgi:hypothetical protein